MIGHDRIRYNEAASEVPAPRRRDTTRGSDPQMASTSVTLSTLQQTLARAIAAGTHDKGRLERAAALVVMGAVTQASERECTVVSQTDGRTVYIVTPDGCDC